MSQTFNPNGIFGGLNLLKRSENRILLDPGQRPPYPILITQPTVRETVANFNRADLAILLVYTLVGFPVARKVVNTPVASEHLKRSMFKLTWTAFMTFGAFTAFSNSYYRLVGLVDNGLVWRRKEESIKKYDFTSDYLKGTIWNFFRVEKKDQEEIK